MKDQTCSSRLKEDVMEYSGSDLSVLLGFTYTSLDTRIIIIFDPLKDYNYYYIYNLSI